MKNEAADETSTGGSKTWRAQISAWRRSGLNGKEFCRRQQISYDAFVYWKKKLTDGKPAGLSLVPVADILAASVKPQSGPGVKIDLGERSKSRCMMDFRWRRWPGSSRLTPKSSRGS